ncbi:30S ribosomal protein S13 [archaeon]
MAEEELRHIVRIAGKDIKGGLPMSMALTHVKGVSTALANAIAKQASEALGVDEKIQLGMLDEKQIEVIEKILLEPSKHGIPIWMLNRRKEPVKGGDTHLTGHELDFAVKGDIDKEKKLRSYRGVRHSQGLTVRGQRTRTSGRKGQTVGVKRKKGTKGSGK